ncbi:MAG TPA: RagB/SusD family nutrient uptake outer membrane protein, partial [Chryseosolibacter sp.]|nr:RagB/SusD family nutrient uptake outer membrane protein [Chryseosolibacter sp.]
TPNGSLDASVLATAEGIDGLLIGAYSMLDGVSGQGFGWEAASSNWVYGSIRGMEANKGTDSGDQPDINPIQTFSENSTNPYLNVKWRSVYEAISRCNATLDVIAEAEAAGTVTADQATSFRRQARVLRGWYHFEAYRMWAKSDGTGIPYVTEETDQATLTNTIDVRPMIIADLTEGTNLPDDMDQIGRFNGTVSKVLLAKAQMQMNQDYAAAKPLLEYVKASGKKPDGSAIGLDPKYGDIFDAAKRNSSPENIYTIQYSVNDGSGGWNAGWGEVLNFPYKGGGSPGGCCGFFQPNQEFVNSFRTSGGLPLLDFSYNNNPVESDQGLAVGDPFTEDTDPLDPRLDWTVGRRGIPYLDWGPHTGQDWIRDQSYAGPYSPKKQVYKKSQEGQLTEVGNWTSGWTANGYRLIRYAEVLLLLAECQIETNDLAGALTNINLVRARAANPDGFVKEANGTTNAANYQISQYPAFANATVATNALRMERKLELGMEGHRYFDLQRWGIVVEELNRILTYEKSLRPSQFGSATVGPEDINYPIPQRQIDLSNGNLIQNR